MKPEPCEFKLRDGYRDDPPEWCDYDAVEDSPYCQHHTELTDTASRIERRWEMETDR